MCEVSAGFVGGGAWGGDFCGVVCVCARVCVSWWWWVWTQCSQPRAGRCLSPGLGEGDGAWWLGCPALQCGSSVWLSEILAHPVAGAPVLGSSPLPQAALPTLWLSGLREGG